MLQRLVAQISAMGKRTKFFVIDEMVGSSDRVENVEDCRTHCFLRTWIAFEERSSDKLR